MYKIIVMYAMAILMLTRGCDTVPITGRMQLNIVSDSEVLELSQETYDYFMHVAAKSRRRDQSVRVVHVGRRLATATEDYLRANGKEADVANFDWEFNLMRSTTVNAWCLPGGKVIVCEGIMDMVESDDELAVVMGHEVAHAMARHSNERLSQYKLAKLGSTIVGILTGGVGDNKSMAQQVFGLGATLGVMQPFSRKHETEADYMGLILMAQAGYDPDAAVALWQRMTAESTSNVPEILSSHPSDATRIADIQRHLPEVKAKYYKPVN